MLFLADIEMPKTDPRPSMVKRVMSTLRSRIFTLPDGEMLGSEEAIMAELGVSRPTFRQAAKLLEQEQLLLIKRGVGGGYFARRPSIKAVAHTAAVFLHSRNATLADVIAASRPLFIETSRLAAGRFKTHPCAGLEAFAAEEHSKLDSGEINLDEFLASERQFWRLISPLSGNPVLELFLMVVFDFAARMTRSSVYEGASRLRSYRTMRSQLLDAVVQGDAEVAEVLARRCNEMLTAWLEQRSNDEDSPFITVAADVAAPARAPSKPAIARKRARSNLDKLAKT